MNILDLSILILFLLGTIWIGLRGRAKSGSLKDYFLGGRQLPWWALSLSLVATETSTLTFLGIPSLSYTGDFSFLSLAMGYILGRILSAIFILPQFANGEFISIYQWVGLKFGKSSQQSLSLLFSTIRILADGVRLYITSIPLSLLLQSIFPEDFSFFQISLISLGILSIITVVYSAYGGFRAVVWTDFLQFFVYTLGAIGILVLLTYDYGNIFQESVIPSEKFQVFHFSYYTYDGKIDAYFFPFAILGGILLSLGSHGVDQMLVQRVLACKSLRESRMALILSGFLVFFQFLVFLLIGSYLTIAIPESKDPSQVFSEYILSRLPSPFLGIVLAGVFASSMSTLSSTLNSLSLTVRIDLKWKILEKISPTFLTIFWGLVLYWTSILPFYLGETLKANLVEIGLTIASYIFGPMIGLFFLEILGLSEWEKKKQNPFHFPLILLLSTLTVLVLQIQFRFPFTWIIGLGIFVFYTFYFSVFFLFKILVLVRREP
jgi:Na+/proline symporter